MLIIQIKEIKTFTNEIYQLYLNTYNKSNYKLEKLEKGFFDKIDETKIVFYKNNEYVVDSTDNIAYCLNNTYLPKLKTSITNSGGDATGVAVRLVTTTEITALTTANKASTQVTSTGQRTWIMGQMNYYIPLALLEDGVIIDGIVGIIGARPVITLLKENILDKLSAHSLLNLLFFFSFFIQLTNNVLPVALSPYT